MSRFLAFTREPGSRPPGSTGPDSADRSGSEPDPLLSFNAEGEAPPAGGAPAPAVSDSASSTTESPAGPPAGQGAASQLSAPSQDSVESVERREKPDPKKLVPLSPAAVSAAAGRSASAGSDAAASASTAARPGSPAAPSTPARPASAASGGRQTPSAPLAAPAADTHGPALDTHEIEPKNRFALSAYTWLWFFAAFALMAVAIAASRFPFPGAPAAAAGAAVPVAGTASFDSSPTGAQVRIDGVARGVTPVKLSIPPGQHTVEIQSGDAVRSLPLTIEPGATVSQFVEFASATAPVVGRLEVVSDPAGAQVRVDGEVRGVTPLSLDSIAPGDHAITVSSGETIVRRRVTVAAGATANVAVSIAASEHAAGWIAWKTPFEMDVYQDGNLLGTTNIDRLMLPAGRHQLELVNDTYGFRSCVAVQVQPGQTTTPAVSIPEGSLSINALPWAEVFVDGRPAGTTPLGNLSVSIGQHEIVWRHPELGERRQTVAVTANTPARIGVDLTR